MGILNKWLYCKWEHVDSCSTLPLLPRETSLCLGPGFPSPIPAHINPSPLGFRECAGA